uniref:NADH dehydrogenase subunit 2 n=1 Tax=Pheidole nodus TaxID=615271 RepID=UPI002580F400|nr:NADH dehydrogenase subunit 2 [Pheidole nodus]WGV34022.1 NADH dehydrogenase subunit 2 [Pheidole nodus]
MIMFLNYFIIPNITIMSFLSLFFTDFFMIWLILEINNFLFICALNLSMNNKKMIFFYFLIQVMASFIIIFIIIFNNLLIKNNFMIFMLISALMIKLSIPPLHLWLPLMVKSLPWNMLLILLTIQKIIPFYMMSLIPLHPYFLYSIIIICSILPPYIMLNMTNFKMLMAYSSINQSSWMFLLIYLKTIIWFKYFLFYTIISLSLFFILNLSKTIMSFSYLKSSFKFNMLFIIFMFNMSGLPPFSFFYMKWYSMFIFILSSNMLIILILMMISSLVMLYIYINMMINLFFTNKVKSKMINLNLSFNNKFMSILFIALFSSSVILML